MWITLKNPALSKIVTKGSPKKVVTSIASQSMASETISAEWINPVSTELKSENSFRRFDSQKN